MAARLRNTFQYDDGDDQDDTHDEMDEEEQENLIKQLQTQNQSMNDMYIYAFSIFPLTLVPVFIFYLVSPTSVGTARLLSLLSMTSLAGSAFKMWFVPYSHEKPAHTKVRKFAPLDIEIDHDGPLGRFLPYLNLGICGVLAVSAWGVRRRTDMAGPFWIYLLLPSVVLATVSFARRSMSDVDQGIGELGKLRYEYKGA